MYSDVLKYRKLGLTGHSVAWKYNRCTFSHPPVIYSRDGDASPCSVPNFIIMQKHQRRHHVFSLLKGIPRLSLDYYSMIIMTISWCD